MMATRADIVKRARDYKGTPFKHQGRLLGDGVDCVGLALCVAEDLGLLDLSGKPLLRRDHISYSEQPNGTQVYDTTALRLKRKPISELRSGDLLCLRVPDQPTHVAIVSEFNGVPYIIHAYNGNKEEVVEHRLDAVWRRNIVAAFEFPGVED